MITKIKELFGYIKWKIRKYFQMRKAKKEDPFLYK
jgi:hypothetical protein